jgi:uncharacterized protein YukJ
MSNLTYSLLKGRVLEAKPFSSNPQQRPHYHLLIQGQSEQQFDVAVNIASEPPHVHGAGGTNTPDIRVLYAIKKDIKPLTAEQLTGLADGCLDLPKSSPLRLDYVADNLVSNSEMTLLPLFDPAAGQNGEDEIMKLIDQTVNNPQVRVYAFGHRYLDKRPKNDAWGFSPDDGVHNIHMNQGNYTGNHDNENGRHEDGALWVYSHSTNIWSGVYIKFQTQSWNNLPDGYPKDDPKHSH